MWAYDSNGTGRSVTRRREYKGVKEKQRDLTNLSYEEEKLRPPLKYAVIGGLVCSRSDGQTHRVSAARLAELYRLDPKECVLCEDDEEARYNLLGVVPGQLLVLRPRHDGDYSLPGGSEVGRAS